MCAILGKIEDRKLSKNSEKLCLAVLQNLFWWVIYVSVLIERKELSHRLFNNFLLFAEQELACYSAVKKRFAGFYWFLLLHKIFRLKKII